MCLGIPGRITSITDGAMPMATLDFAGDTRQCCLAYVPEATVGDWVYIQNGFAHDIISEDDARDTLAALDQYELLNPLAAGGLVSRPQETLHSSSSSISTKKEK